MSRQNYTYDEIKKIFNQDISGFCKFGCRELILSIKEKEDAKWKYFEVISDLNTNLYNSVELVRKYYENGDIEDC